MRNNPYQLRDSDDIISPALIYYKDIIVENTKKAIAVAGGADKLWPHVKTHKMLEMAKLQMQMGISRFKCATVAEAEMLAMAGAPHILLAHPLVGPNVARYLRLMKAYPNLTFYAIGDDFTQLKRLSDAALAEGMRVPALIDVNMGMNRTGIELNKLQALYEQCAALPGLSLVGLHCYDGHHSISDVQERQRAVDAVDAEITRIQSALREKGIACDILIAGGSPSFPCHARATEWYLSPGTLFIHDKNYQNMLRDMDMQPGGILFTRVISYPANGIFTLDLGYKGVASDSPMEKRGVIVGMEDLARPIAQSEEHWVFQMNEGQEFEMPPIGSALYVIPGHICPTSALYPSALVAQDGEIVDEWEVTARNRKITY